MGDSCSKSWLSKTLMNWIKLLSQLLFLLLSQFQEDAAKDETLPKAKTSCSIFSMNSSWFHPCSALTLSIPAGYEAEAAATC